MEKPIDQGVADLCVGSEAIGNIPQTEIPGHAIVGIAPDFSLTESTPIKGLNAILNKFNIHMANGQPATIDTIFGGAKTHDTIVGVNSQRGGLPRCTDAQLLSWQLPAEGANECQTNEVSGIVHAPALEHLDPHYGETESKDVHTHIVRLLLTNIQLDNVSRQPIETADFGFFTHFPASTVSPYTTCQAPNQKTEQEASAYLSDAVLTIEPVSGTVVKPGETVQLRFDIAEGTQQSSALFSIDGDLIAIEGEPPYVVDYTIPAYKTGKLNIYADTSSSTEETYAITSSLLVVPEGSPVSIKSSREEVFLTSIGAMYQLEILGTYSDGFEYDLSSSAVGTTYMLQSGTDAVISISADGLLEARGAGQETVLVTNSGQTTSIVVTVK